MAASKKVTIPQIDIDDIPSVYGLGEKYFASEDFPTSYLTWDPYEVTEYFTTDPNYCLVAEVQESIVGFVLGTTVEKERTAWKKIWLPCMDIDRRRISRHSYWKTPISRTGEEMSQ